MKRLTKKQLDELVNTKDDDLLVKFPGFTRAELRRLKKQELAKEKPIEQIIEEDRIIKKKTEKIKETSKKYQHLLEKVEQLEAEKDAIIKLTYPVQVKKIEVTEDDKNEEAVAVIVASDWHIEELVKPQDVNDLNAYNITIAEKRIEKFWQNSLKLLRGVERDNRINTVVLALLGDFISGNIHDELLETNQLLPAEAIFRVQEYLINGINFMLENTDKNFVIHCVPGNHTRITKKIRHATFSGNSLEDFMYHNLALYYRNEKRIKFNIPSSYLSYMDILGVTVRFHHGHALRYHGGVGGIYIPVNKAINQWNKGRHADLDVFGHWHQLKDGGNFLINGSLIGYNAFAVSIKADFEEPRQLFFVINQYGRTGYNKIVVS